MRYGRLFVFSLLLCFALSSMALATEPVEGGGETSTPVAETGSSDAGSTDTGSTDTGSGESSVPAETPSGDTGSGDSGTDTGTETETESTGEEVTGEETTGDDPFGSGVLYVEPDPVVMGYSTYDLTAPDARTESTLASAVVSVFGEYQPITHTVTDHLSDGSSVTYEQVVPGLAGVDWVWVSGVAIFALMLYSLFRLLGVFVK